MDLSRPAPRGSLPDTLNSGPNSSWHSSRDPPSSSASSDPQSTSQAQPYSSGYGPPSFDGFLHPMGSQGDLLPSPADNGPSSDRMNKKRNRDDHDDLDPHSDGPSKYNPSPARLAELTAGFPTPPNSNGPPALITTGRMTKTHADPLIAQLINPDGTPKRPMNAFMIFARKRRPEVAADNPNLRTGEISKLLSAEWKGIDNESKQFYLQKAKELKENFTSIFPTYVYKRRPNNSRKRRKTEDTGYGGAAAMSAIDRGEGGLSDDENDLTPPGGMSPGMGHPGHHMGMPSLPGMGGVPRRPGDSMHMSHSGMIPPPPPHSGLSGPYGGHVSQDYGRGQGSPQMYYDNGPRSGGSGNSNGPPNLRVPGGPPPPPGQSGSGSMRNGSSSGGYNNFSIPSPNFGPGPGLPPIARGGPGGGGSGGQGGSNPPSASQTPLLNPTLPGAGSMLPPPAGSLYGHSSHSSSHAHSGSYFESSGWPRGSSTQQSPSSSTTNLNGPSGTSSTPGPPTSGGRQTPTGSSRNRSDSLQGAGTGGATGSSGSGSWNI